MPASWIQQSGQFLLDLLLPPRCFHCEAAGSWLCDECFNQIQFIDTAVCHRCGTPIDATLKCQQCFIHPLQYIDGIRSAAYFDDNPIRSAIHQLKYRNHTAVAAVLAQFLADTVARHQLAADVIVPVPLHRSRHKTRGYNQSYLLAKHLGDLLNLPVNTTTLERTRQTKSQMSLGVQERRQNVADAFAAHNNRLAGQRVFLIDDVCTTGATSDACAAALKAGNAATVWGLTLAKAL